VEEEWWERECEWENDDRAAVFDSILRARGKWESAAYEWCNKETWYIAFRVFKSVLSLFTSTAVKGNERRDNRSSSWGVPWRRERRKRVRMIPRWRMDGDDDVDNNNERNDDDDDDVVVDDDDAEGLESEGWRWWLLSVWAAVCDDDDDVVVVVVVVDADSFPAYDWSRKR
jgi:hypothetical protein